jgi:uncharacterized membrane protein
MKQETTIKSALPTSVAKPTRRSALITAALQPERIVALLGLLFGLLFLVTLPPFQGTDEAAHFYRAYQVATGQIFAERAGDKSGGTLPASAIATVNALFYNDNYPSEKPFRNSELGNWLVYPLAPEQRAFVDFRNTALYSPIPYLPAALGISIGHHLGLAPLVALYLGRLTVLLVTVTFVVLAVRITPIGKWLMVGLALIPAAACARSGIGLDGISLSTSMLFTALVLHYTYHNILRLGWRDLLLLVLVASAVAMTRQVYVLLFGLIFLIPMARLGGWVRGSLTIAGLSVVVAGAALGWTLINATAYVPVVPGRSDPSSAEYRNPDASKLDVEFSPRDQLAYVLSSPGAFVQSVWSLVARNVGERVGYALGGFGWSGNITLLHQFLYAVGLVLLVLIGDQRAAWLHWRTRVWCAVIVGGGTLATIAAAYLLWNDIGSERISGVQPRYFVPLLPAAALIGFGWLGKWLIQLPLRIPGIIFGILSLLATWYEAFYWYYLRIGF